MYNAWVLYSPAYSSRYCGWGMGSIFRLSQGCSCSSSIFRTCPRQQGMYTGGVDEAIVTGKEIVSVCLLPCRTVCVCQHSDMSLPASLYIPTLLPFSLSLSCCGVQVAMAAPRPCSKTPSMSSLQVRVQSLEFRI